MTDQPRKATPRGSPASQFDAMTVALLAVLILVAACAVLEIGPAEALDRIGCGLNDAVNSLLAYPRPCH